VAETAIGRERGDESHLPPPQAHLPTSLRAAFNLAATGVASWLAEDGNPPPVRAWADGSTTADCLAGNLVGRVVTVDLASFATASHLLTTRPQCAECGTVEYPLSAHHEPITLSSVKKRFTADGGHRCMPPAETFARLAHQISPITGIVAGLERVGESAGSLTPVYGTKLTLSGVPDLEWVRRMRGCQGVGKGMTDHQARVSALAEAVERYAAVWVGDTEIRRRCSYRELGERAVDPRDVLRFSESQYRNREAWNRTHRHASTWIPEPFDETRAVDWTPVWSLTNGVERFLPTALCYIDYPYPDGPRFALADSNGNAAGNTLEEAVLQGFLELVERDAVAIWWYCRLSRPAVDLSSVDETYLPELLEFYRSRERELWVLDLTNDLGIPVFVAVSRHTGKGWKRIAVGCGAHFDARLAVLRAVTECNQGIAALNTLYFKVIEDADERDNLGRPGASGNGDYRFLEADDGAPLRGLDDPPRWQSDDIRDDVQRCIEVAAAHGLETLILDQTRPDVAMPAVKVFVPGLHHFWRRLGPGRLYDVPYRLGWLEEPMAEKDLNPVPFSF